MAWPVKNFPFRQVTHFHSDKCSLSLRLSSLPRAAFDALHLRILLGLIIMVQVVRHRRRRGPLTLLHQLRLRQSGRARFGRAAVTTE